MRRSGSGSARKMPHRYSGMLHVAEVRPPLLADRDGGAQIHGVVLEGDRTELRPPLDELRLPRLQRTLQAAVAGEVDVVRDLGVDVDGAHAASCAHTLASVVSQVASPCRSCAARLGPDGVRSLEDPVLPGRQAGEDLRLHASRGRRSGGSPPCRSARRARSCCAPRASRAPRRPSRCRRART